VTPVPHDSLILAHYRSPYLVFDIRMHTKAQKTECLQNTV